MTRSVIILRLVMDLLIEYLEVPSRMISCSRPSLKSACLLDVPSMIRYNGRDTTHWPEG